MECGVFLAGSECLRGSILGEKMELQREYGMVRHHNIRTRCCAIDIGQSDGEVVSCRGDPRGISLIGSRWSLVERVSGFFHFSPSRIICLQGILHPAYLLRIWDDAFQEYHRKEERYARDHDGDKERRATFRMCRGGRGHG